MSPKRRFFPWQPGEDGFSALDRLGQGITSSRLWVRFAAPVGVILVIAALAGAIFGVVTLVGTSDESEPSVVIQTASTPVALATATAAASPTPSLQAQALTQPISVEVFRNSTYVWPASGRLSRADPAGLSIQLGVDPAVKASGRGVVSLVESNTVEIEHEGGITSRYFNLAGVSASTGQRVEKGEIIGYGASAGAGSIGPLRFETRSGSQVLDPRLLLPATGPDPSNAKTSTVSCPEAPINVDAASSVNLMLASDELRSLRLQSVSVRTQMANAPGISSRVRGDLGVTMEIEQARSVTPAVQEYTLDLSFSGASGQAPRTASCPLTLLIATSVPLAAGEIAPPAAPTEDVVPVPSATRVSGAPTAPRTATPIRTATATIVATATGSPGTQTPVSGTSTPARSATPARTSTP